MTPREQATLRDQVARARLDPDPTAKPNKLGWSPERLAAGDNALAALREATRRASGR